MSEQRTIDPNVEGNWCAECGHLLSTGHSDKCSWTPHPVEQRFSKNRLSDPFIKEAYRLLVLAMPDKDQCDSPVSEEQWMDDCDAWLKQAEQPDETPAMQVTMCTCLVLSGGLRGHNPKCPMHNRLPENGEGSR